VNNFIPAIFGTAVFVYGGWIFLQGAWRELADRNPGMMTLIGLAISVAFIYSAAVTLGFPGHALWWELATLVTIMLLGHWIEMRSIFQAQGALKELAKLLPDTALRVIGDDETEEVPVDELRDGDLLLIRPGASIPADGLVKSGKSSVNEALITGESKPVDKQEGEKVIAGTVNGQGSLAGRGDRVRRGDGAGRVSCGSSNRRKDRGSRAQALADRAAFYLTLVALGAGALTFACMAGRGSHARLHHHPPGHRAGDRLPARAGDGGAAGRRHLHHDGGSQRPSGPRPARPRGSAQPECRRIRQDRHPDAG
jgi:P-type Cu2+ transporter